MSIQRDSQRSAVYQAENFLRTIFDRAAENGLPVLEFFGAQLTLPVEVKFASIDSVQKYVDRVLSLRDIHNRWAKAIEPVLIRPRKGLTAAHYEPDTQTIALPIHRANQAWALRELVVLHELAHHLDNSSGPAHGPNFVQTHIELLEIVMGPEVAHILQIILLNNGFHKYSH
ncbi:MAG: TIGR04338 family metallohydrolase [Mycobacteriaceae bacterium]